MNRMDQAAWKTKQQEDIAFIEKTLEEFLPQNPSYQKTIFDAMEYSVMGGGKRLRPMMIWESYCMFDGKEEKLVKPFMAALEMIHTYSLVHDDLPAMDNDEYRRGRKTTHVVFGHDMGILAGDALLNFAFETASDALSISGSEKQAAKALQILAKKAGIYGMVGGQVVDVELTGKSMSSEQLNFIYELKTGALLEAALMIGAALAGASQEEIEIMEQVGKNVGMAFQIQDDILDVTSTTEELGKPVHSDEKNEKNTYVEIYGMEASLQAVEQYSQKAMGMLNELPQKNMFLYELIEKLIHRKK